MGQQQTEAQITNLLAETKWFAWIIFQVNLQVTANGINIRGDEEFASIRVAVEFVTDLKLKKSLVKTPPSNK